MSTPTIEDRLILLLKDQMPASALEQAEQEENSMTTRFFNKFGKGGLGGHGFWQRLEQYTGVSAQRWRGAFNRRQHPLPDMIEAAAKLWPNYAFWLATGITDATNGHVAPVTALTFPERLYSASTTNHQYLRKSLELYEQLYAEGGVDCSDDAARLHAIERVCPAGNAGPWWASALLDTAYELGTTEDYKSLQALWEEREEERSKAIDWIRNKENRPWIKKRIDSKAKGLDSHAIPFRDPRTLHQDNWDLFFIQKAKNDNQES